VCRGCSFSLRFVLPRSSEAVTLSFGIQVSLTDSSFIHSINRLVAGRVHVQ
jgi:hypothetical protein